VSQNKVIRRIIGHKREEVVGGWRRLHNVKLHDFTLQIKEYKMEHWGL
jgi:hypothetical protein